MSAHGVVGDDQCVLQHRGDLVELLGGSAAFFASVIPMCIYIHPNKQLECLAVMSNMSPCTRKVVALK